MHWTLIGHALSDSAKVRFDGLNISRGVFAPAIEYHEGTFYVVNTLVDAGGNFFVTATNPRGPWSDPIWLKEIDGIDPSFFFDDGWQGLCPQQRAARRARRCTTAIVPSGSRSSTPRPTSSSGPRKVIVNGGVDISKQPIWIEGPHLYRIKDWYYLMCAEGGTGSDHSEVIFRAKSPWGPFEAWKGNPILTQRDLPANRANPVTNAGHADCCRWRMAAGGPCSWRRGPTTDYLFNTGRETWLLPVSWKEGWPVILEHGKAIPYSLKGPKALARAKDAGGDALAGNFTSRDDFNMAEPGTSGCRSTCPNNAGSN